MGKVIKEVFYSLINQEDFIWFCMITISSIYLDLKDVIKWLSKYELLCEIDLRS